MKNFKHTSIENQIRIFNLTEDEAKEKIKLYREKLKKRNHGSKKYNQYSVEDQIRIFNLTEDEAKEKIKDIKKRTSPKGKTTKEYWMNKRMSESDATLKAKTYKEAISTSKLTSDYKWQMKRFNLTREEAEEKIKNAFAKRRSSYIKLKEIDFFRWKSIRKQNKEFWIRKGFSKQKSIINAKEYRENNRNKFVELMKNEDYADAHFKKSVGYKKFKMPSGCIVNLQGYEPQVLSELLEIYNENNIIVGVKEINKEIGKIEYCWKNKIHRYYPDFFIKQENKIIEVKSQWTYNKWKEKNELKKQACLDAGFNFEFKIYSQR